MVRRVARHVPFPAVCLPQAMALQWMLHRRGVESRLVFGARRKLHGRERSGTGRDDGKPSGLPRRAHGTGLDFHAWLTVGGECVIGADEIGTYTALPPFDGIGPRPG